MKNKSKPAVQANAAAAAPPAPKSKVLLKFVVSFAALFIAFEICYMNEYLYNHIFQHINSLFAHLSAAVLNLMGIHAKSTAETISDGTFSISVKQGCDSIEALGIFVFGVIAFPSKLPVKLYGLLIGSTIILTLNLIRLVHLFWIGLYHHDLFDLFHLEIWQAFFIVLSIVLWVLWVMRAVKPEKPVPHAE